MARLLLLGPNVEIEHPMVQDAKDFVEASARDFSGAADGIFRRGKVVGFKKKFLAVFVDDEPSRLVDEAPQQGARNRKISASSAE